VPVGWAWAADTPFQWTKQVSSHFGGTRNPLIVYWPKGLQAKGELRTQFHHVIDIAPTVLEAAGIREPKVVNGVEQKPIEGVSMLYSFNHGRAAPRRTVQYFEMFGNRGIYKDGWMASARHGRLPWETAGASGDFDQHKWELYNLSEDFSQAHDLAAKHPEKVKELQAAFLAAVGGVTSGWSLYVKDGKPTFYYNFFEVEKYRVQSSETVPQGKSTVRVEFTPIEPGPGKPATVKLYVNGKQTGESRVEKTVPFRYSVEPFDVGMDNVSAVSEKYKPPFPFKGRIEQVTIELK
jgi:hypothetical protein